MPLHEVQGLPAFGIALYISRMTVAECGRDPMTRHAAGEQSLEGVPESTGYVLNATTWRPPLFCEINDNHPARRLSNEL